MSVTVETPQLNLAAAERISRLRETGRPVIHVFRRITLQDWCEYGQRAATPMKHQGKSLVVTHGAHLEAAWELWDRAILRIEKRGSGDELVTVGGADAPDGWKDSVDPTHQALAVELLQEIYPMSAGEDDEGKWVRLEATWNGDAFEHLVHRFRMPMKEHILRYRRQDVHYIRVEGSRKPTTLIQHADTLRTLCELYDQLVLRVQGYALPFEGPAVQQAMDPLHKQAAVVELFERRTMKD